MTLYPCLNIRSCTTSMGEPLWYGVKSTQFYNFLRVIQKTQYLVQFVPKRLRFFSSMPFPHKRWRHIVFPRQCLCMDHFSDATQHLNRSKEAQEYQIVVPICVFVKKTAKTSDHKLERYSRLYFLVRSFVVERKPLK